MKYLAIAVSSFFIMVGTLIAAAICVIVALGLLVGLLALLNENL